MLTEVIYLCYVDAGEYDDFSHELAFVATSELRGRAMLIDYAKTFYAKYVGAPSFKAYLIPLHIDHPGDDAWGIEIDLTKQIREDIGIPTSSLPLNKLFEADFAEHEKRFLSNNDVFLQREKFLSELYGSEFVPEKSFSIEDNKNG